MSAPVVTFVSDYGLVDEFVGVCHAVIAWICPEVRIIDLTHGIPRHDIRSGALILAAALPYTPPGVHLAVVDPEVGGRRRAVALELADGRLLVGPDNGLLWPAASGAGGVVSAVEISHSPWRLDPVSATFHGRDIFAPVAARLASGEPIASAGEPVDPAELIALELPGARREGDGLRTGVTYVDRFGNLQLGAGHDDIEAIGLQLGHEVVLRLPGEAEHVARYVRAFAEARGGELIVYEDASGRLAIAVDHGSAGERLGLQPGDELHVAAAR
jgi:hypothetical protein